MGHAGVHDIHFTPASTDVSKQPGNQPSIILSFCACCGDLLRHGKGLESNPRCDNCNHSVAARSDRLEGTFKYEEAMKLANIYTDIETS